MRVSVAETPRAWEWDVYLDGVKVDLCIAADDEEGWVRHYERDATGRIRMVGCEMVVIFRTGLVQLVGPADGAPNPAAFNRTTLPTTEGGHDGI